MMITRLILRLGLLIGIFMAVGCIIALSVGGTIPTTRVVGYLSHLRDETHAFGIADINRRVFTIAPVPFESDWQVIFSPDGERVLMTLDFYGQVEFYMLDLRTYALTRFPLGYNVCAPPRETIRWSPDNEYVLFHCRPNTITSELNGLQMWHIDANTIERLYEPIGFELVPYSWSPNGEYLSLINNGVVVIINIPTRQFLRPSSTEQAYSAMQWSPQGNQVALTAQNRLFIYDIASRTTTPILEDVDSGVAYWSPNGEWVATISQKGGYSTVYTWDLVDGRAYKMGTDRYPMNMSVDIRWSGDSEWLLIQQDVNQADRFAPIFVTSRDGVEGHLITTDGRNPRWIGDSLAMTYNVNQTERLRFGRDLVSLMLPDIQAQNPIPRLWSMDVLSHTWLEDGRLLTWQSIDRYGGTRAIKISPASGGMGWSLFPATYSVSQVVVWR